MTGLAFRMKSALFLCLLLCISQGQSQVLVNQEDVRKGLHNIRMGTTAPPEFPVLWDELWGLKELVLSLKAMEVEQRQAWRSMESRLRDREVEAEQQRQSLEGLKEIVVRQRGELIETQVRTDTDRKLLTDLDSDVRIKVEELEEQSKGG